MATEPNPTNSGIEIYNGKAKETGNPFTALKITIGTWSTLYFPKTKFEMDYIKKYIETGESQF